jgi:hypothetical protein
MEQPETNQAAERASGSLERIVSQQRTSNHILFLSALRRADEPEA